MDQLNKLKELLTEIFQPIINEAVREAIKKELADANITKMEKPDRWMNVYELADYIPGGVAVTTIYGKVQRREIPFHREGKRLLFLESEINEWLKSKRTRTAEDIAKDADDYIANKK